MENFIVEFNDTESFALKEIARKKKFKTVSELIKHYVYMNTDIEYCRDKTLEEFEKRCAIAQFRRGNYWQESLTNLRGDK